MSITQQDLIADLKIRTQRVLEEAKSMVGTDEDILNHKPSPERWSVLECLEHLNRYGNYYLPEVKRVMKKSPTVSASKAFRTGWLGDYFAKSMLPKEKLNTMKTFKSMNPAGSDLTEAVLYRFIEQQQEWLKLLEQLPTKELTRSRTGITISKWIRLRLGDTLRVVIYHNQRHLVQVQKVRAEWPVAEGVEG